MDGIVNVSEFSRIVHNLEEYEQCELSSVFKPTDLKGEDEIIQWLKEQLAIHKGKNEISEYLTAIFIVLKCRLSGKLEDSLAVADEYIELTQKRGGLEFFSGIFTRVKGSVLHEMEKDVEEVISHLEESVTLFEKAEKQVKMEKESHKKSVIRIEKAVTQMRISSVFYLSKRFEKVYEIATKPLKLLYEIENLDQFKSIHLNHIVVLFSEACSKLGKFNECRMSLMKAVKVLNSVESYTEIFRRQKIELMKRIADTYFEDGRLDVALKIQQRALEICPEENVMDKYVLIHAVCNILIRKFKFEEFLKTHEQLPNVKELLNFRERLDRRAEFIKANLGNEERLKEHLLKFVSEDEKKRFKRRTKCNACEKNGDLRCSVCKIIFYCGRDCQAKDWKDHKEYCVNLMEI